MKKTWRACHQLLRKLFIRFQMFKLPLKDPARTRFRFRLLFMAILVPSILSLLIFHEHFLKVSERGKREKLLAEFFHARWWLSENRFLIVIPRGVLGVHWKTQPSNERSLRKCGKWPGKFGERSQWRRFRQVGAGVLAIIYYVPQVFHYTSISLSFICCLLWWEKKVEKITAKRGGIPYQPHRGRCHIPSLLIYSYLVAHFLRHFSSYSHKGLPPKRKKTEDEEEETEVWRPSVDFE